MYFMTHGGMQWYGKGLVHDSGVVWQGCGMTLWCGCTGGRCLGLHWEDPRDQAQRGGRQAGGWLLFDAALVWFCFRVWFWFILVQCRCGVPMALCWRQWILYWTQEYNIVRQAGEQNHDVDKSHAEMLS